MNQRRNFLRLAAAALPAAAFTGASQGANASGRGILGAWTTLHSSPFGPFRELLVFAEGGGLTETNVLLHTNSNLAAFAPAGLPAAVNASDGIGNWERTGPNQIRVSFRKLLFDGTGSYFGDFWVKGTLSIHGDTLHADWDQIWIMGTENQLLLNLGTATSGGTRI